MNLLSPGVAEGHAWGSSLTIPHIPHIPHAMGNHSVMGADISAHADPYPSPLPEGEGTKQASRKERQDKEGLFNRSGSR